MDTIKKYFNRSMVVDNVELTVTDENSRLHFTDNDCNESKNNEVSLITKI